MSFQFLNESQSTEREKNNRINLLLRSVADLQTAVTSLQSSVSALNSTPASSGSSSVTASAILTALFGPAAGSAGFPLVSNDSVSNPAFQQMLIADGVGTIVTAVSNGDLSPGIIMPWAGSLIALRTQCSSGTCTMTIKNGSLAVSGISNAVSSSLAISYPTANNNVFSVGDYLVPNFASASACVNLSWTAIFTRLVP